MKDYLEFKNKFGQKDTLLLGIYAEDVFAQDFLLNLKSLHRSLEEQIPYTVGVSSLLTLNVFQNDDNQLGISTLMEHWPTTQASLEENIARIKSNPIYSNRYFSPGGNFTIVFISIDPCLSSKYQQPDTLEGFFEDLTDTAPTETESVHCTLANGETTQMIQALSHVIERYNRENFKIYATGLPVYKHFIRQTMKKDAVTFVSLSSLVILFFLYLFFRHKQGVFLPFVIVCFSMSSTLGLMVLFDRPIKTPTTILPSLLLVVGLGDSIHILSLYYRNLARGLCRENAIAVAVGKSGKALLITSLTTAMGIASFAGADVAPVADLGLFGSIGVLIAFIYTLVLLPAFLGLFPERTPLNPRGIFRPGLDALMERIALFSTRHSKKVVVFSLVLVLACTAGVMRLKITHNPLVWLSQQEPIRRATEKIDQAIEGMINVEILIQSKDESMFHSPAMLKAIERLHLYFKENLIGNIQVHKTFSIVDVVKFTHFVLNDNQPGFYKIPENPSAIFQQLLIVEMGSRNVLKDLTGFDDDTARFTAYVPWMDAVAYAPFLDQIQDRCEQIFGEEYNISITGQIPLLARTLSATIHSMVESYRLCFLTITALMIILLSSFRMGLFSMIPNFLPVWVSLGIMGWLQFPLDMYTLLVGSIVMGIIVDDTVHFMHYFNRYRSEGAPVEKACAMTLKTAGPAMMITTALISAGGLIFLLSALNSLRCFGAAVAGVSLISLVCDLVFVPALLSFVLKDRRGATMLIETQDKEASRIADGVLYSQGESLASKENV